MKFGLLGPLLVTDGDRRLAITAGRQRTLLAALLLGAGRVVAVADLADVVWDGQPPKGARSALHTAVQRLRTTLGQAGRELIRTDPPGYLMQVGPEELDVLRFGQLIGQSQAAAAAGDWPLAASELRAALGLWRGAALEDVPSEALCRREVPHLDEQRLAALVGRIDADLRLGRHDQLVPELRQLTAAEPLQERFYAQLMLALYQSGRQADALTAYHETHQVLAAELGVSPGPALQQLHQRMLAGDPGLLTEAPAGPAPAPAASADPAAPAAPAELATLAAPAPLSGQLASDRLVPRQLPAAVRHFVGRAAELNALHGLLRDGAGAPGTVSILAIVGMAGVGKTSLAITFAHQVASQFPDGQLYLNLRGFGPAGSPVRPGQAVRSFLDAFQVPPARVPAELTAQAALLRSLLAGRRVLLVLDNARDAEQVRPLLPGSPGCVVLVTSRSQLTSLAAAEGAGLLTLDLLTEPEGTDLLTRRLGRDRVGGATRASTELVGLCGRLPLALSIAAARAAANPGLSLATLVTELRATGQRLAGLDAGDAVSDVRAVFSWSCRRLSRPAARMFRLLGLLPGPDISLPGCASLAGMPPDEARQALAELTRTHLVAEPRPGRFTCHDLLRAYAAEESARRDSAAERSAGLHRSVDYYLQAGFAAALCLTPHWNREPPAPPPAGVVRLEFGHTQQAWDWLDTEHLVLLEVIPLAAAAGLDVHAWQLTWVLGEFFDRRGYWHEWAAMLDIALTAAQRAGDISGQARTHHRLGCALAHLRRLPSAEDHLRQAIRLHQADGDRLALARTHDTFTMVLSLQQRSAEGLRYAERAHDLYLLIGDQAGQANALNNIGWFHAEAGDPERALGHCRRSLALHRELGNGKGEAVALDSIGFAWQRAGQPAEAITSFRAALALFRESGNRYHQAGTLTRLGDSYRTIGDEPQAAACWQQALVILDGLGHPDAAGVRGKLHRAQPEPQPSR
jgi:DNA-binding SARP family transcriptional activator